MFLSVFINGIAPVSAIHADVRKPTNYNDVGNASNNAGHTPNAAISINTVHIHFLYLDKLYTIADILSGTALSFFDVYNTYAADITTDIISIILQTDKLNIVYNLNCKV